MYQNYKQKNRMLFIYFSSLVFLLIIIPSKKHSPKIYNLIERSLNLIFYKFPIQKQNLNDNQAFASMPVSFYPHVLLPESDHAFWR